MASYNDEDDISLPSIYRNVPLEALRVSVRTELSLYLNIERLPNEKGIVADYNGLAEQIGFSFLEIQNFARTNVKNPTAEILKEWTRRPDLEPTVGKLYQCLQTMERVDIMTDCKRRILNDIEHYLQMKEKRQDEVVPLQDNTISQSETQDYTDHYCAEDVYMTVQDVENNTKTYYDAFVCYDPEGYDLQFVKKMLEELESKKYGLKMFVPWRDDLPGSSTHTVSAKLIQDRCKRMVIIMSPRFLKSPSCDFQIRFAHSLSPGARSKKLVPVLITACPIPDVLRHVTLCDFTRRDLMEWFWGRLAHAIKAPINIEEVQAPKNVCLEEITLNMDPQLYRSVGSSSSSQLPPIIHVSSPQPSTSSQSNGGSNSSSSSSNSSQPLPIIHSSSTQHFPSNQSSPASTMDHNSTGQYSSPSSMSSIQSTSSLHSVSSSMAQNPNQQSGSRRKR